MEATGIADPFRLSPLTGEFTNIALERDFRQAQWDSWAQQIRVATVLGTALVLLGGVADYLALGWNLRFLQIMAVQATLLLPMTAILLTSGQRGSTLRLDLSIAFFEFYLAAVLCIAIILRPAGAQYYTPAMLVLVLTYYLLVPNRFLLLLICGLGTSLAYLAVLQQIFRPSADELALTAVVFLAVNLLAGFRALHLHHIHRRAFASLRRIAAINDQLQEEIGGRQRVSKQLQERVLFEELLTRLSTRFIDIDRAQVEPQIRNTLAELGEHSKADRCYIFQFDLARHRFSCTHEWCGKDTSPILPVSQALSMQVFSWSMPQLIRGETLHIPRVDALPREASAERQELERHGTRALVLIPLHFDRRVIGFIGLGSVHGERRWPEESILLLRVVGHILISALRRMQSEEILHQVRSQYETLARLAPIGIFRSDAVGNVRYVNERWCEMASMTLPEALNDGWSNAVHPDDLPRVMAVWSAAIATRTPTHSEFRFRHPDGSVIWVSGRAQPEFDGQGRLIGFVGTVDDITARKQVELALQERTHELEQANDELLRSNLELQQFAYVASHDLQEPLRTISGFSQLIAQRYKGRLDHEADELIDYLTGGVSQLHQLITDLLNYSRIDSRIQPFEPMPLERPLALALAHLDTAIREAGAVVTHDPLPQVNGDAMQMTQLLQNLIGNAIKFHRIEPPRVHVAAQRRGNEWLFSVSDNGVGIPPQHATQVFQIFKRLHTRDVYPGTGIGLAVCKRIVEHHHGRIWVEPNPDGGSIFYFTLPVIPNARSAA